MANPRSSPYSTIHCPNKSCRARLRLSNRFLGKTLRCPKCRITFVYQLPSPNQNSTATNDQSGVSEPAVGISVGTFPGSLTTEQGVCRKCGLSILASTVAKYDGYCARCAKVSYGSQPNTAFPHSEPSAHTIIGRARHIMRASCWTVLFAAVLYYSWVPYRWLWSSQNPWRPRMEETRTYRCSLAECNRTDTSPQQLQGSGILGGTKNVTRYFCPEHYGKYDAVIGTGSSSDQRSKEESAHDSIITWFQWAPLTVLRILIAVWMIACGLMLAHSVRFGHPLPSESPARERKKRLV